MSTEQEGPDFTVVYDGDNGEVVVDYGTGITQAIEVRQGMIDQATRHAAVVELERLGYTITKPGAALTNYEYEMLDLIRGLVKVASRLPFDEVDGLDIDDLLERAREIAGRHG